MIVPSFKPSNHPPENAFEKDLEIALDAIFSAIKEILNGGIRITDNLNSRISTITTSATPGTETAIAHGLKRIPAGAIILERDKAGHVFLGSSGKDSENYYVQSDVASVTVSLLIL